MANGTFKVVAVLHVSQDRLKIFCIRFIFFSGPVRHFSKAYKNSNSVEILL